MPLRLVCAHRVTEQRLRTSTTTQSADFETTSGLCRSPYSPPHLHFTPCRPEPSFTLVLEYLAIYPLLARSLRPCPLEALTSHLGGSQRQPWASSLLPTSFCESFLSMLLQSQKNSSVWSVAHIYHKKASSLPHQSNRIRRRLSPT